MGRVLLLRKPGPSAFEGALREAGFECLSIHPIAIELAPHQLPADLSPFEALVMTSSSALEALAQAPYASTLAMPCFVVGEATGQRCRALFPSCPVQVSPGPGASALALYLVEQYPEPPSRPLLFLKGDRALDLLPRALAEANIPLLSRTVYRTLSVGIASQMQRAAPGDWVVVFSPSSARGLGSMDLSPGIRFAALGPSSAQALLDEGLQVSAQAAQPTPAALTHALLTALPQ